MHTVGLVASNECSWNTRMSYSQSSVWDRPKTYKDMLIPYFRCANGIESKCVRPKEYHWEQWTLQCAFTLSRVGINTKFDWRWTENLKIAENCGREICMGAYMSEGCQKSVSSPKTLETIKKVRGGIRSRDPCDKRPTPNQLSYVGSWQILGTNTEYRKPVITDRNWDRWCFQGRVRFAVECHKVKIWSVQAPRTETAYRCLHERGDKGWYWTSLEGPWRKTTKVRMQSCNSFRHRHNA